MGVVHGVNQQIDLETGEIGVHSTPAVAGDVVIVGSAFREGGAIETHDNTKGLVRAFDVRTGKKLWQFNTIPRPGEFGSETWENGSWASNGNVGVWSEISVDEDLGLVYLPVETPTSDFYGGHRPGNNLFAESLVAVDLKTGQRKWHFQFVHHPVWNYDVSSAPILADITVNGQAIKAVAVPSKEAFLYVFYCVTGKPVWPIEERPVPQLTVPGEKTSPTKPLPRRSLPHTRGSRSGKVPGDLIDFTPELHAQAMKLTERYRFGPMFNPPSVAESTGWLGTVHIGNGIGGTNWTGGVDHLETHIAYVPAANAGVASLGVTEPPKEFSDIRYLRGVKGQPFGEIWVPGDCCAADWGYRTRDDLPGLPPAAPGTPQIPPLNVQGLPLVKPPYGLIAAIDLDRGDLLWQTSHGDTPEKCTQSPGTEGTGHSEDRPERQRRIAHHEVARDQRRRADDDDAGASARRDAARLRQEDGKGSRDRPDGRAAKRVADDLQRRRQQVHHRRDQPDRRQWWLFGRVSRADAALGASAPLTMTSRLIGLLVSAVAITALATPAAGQALPRAADGKPDFSGIWRSTALANSASRRWRSTTGGCRACHCLPTARQTTPELGKAALQKRRKQRRE